MISALYDEPNPGERLRHRLLTLLSVAIFLLLAFWAVWKLGSEGRLAARLWAPLLDPDLIILLASGLLSTIKVAFVSMALSVIFGALFAAGMLSKSAWLRVVLRAWIEIFRGLPLLLLIFFLYLGAPAVGIDISGFWALVLGLVLYDSAVMAEIFRAGILSLPRGQAQAAAALGLTEGEIFRLILMPQAVRRMLPALITQLVALLKETSYGFVIGYMEFLRDARSVVEYLGGQYALPVYTAVAVVYIVLNYALSWAATRAEVAL